MAVHMMIPKVTPLPFENVMVAIRKWIDDHEKDDLSQEDIIATYTPEEWAKRGEPHGADSKGIFLVKGYLHAILNFDGDDDLYEDFSDLLESHGYMHELGYSWSVYLYALDA